MKNILFAFLSFLFINVNAQQTQLPISFNVKLDSILVVGTFPSPDNPDYSLQVSVGLVHLEISNQYSKTLNISGNSSMGCEVQIYSEIERKYIDFKTPGDDLKEIRDTKLELLKSGEILKREAEIPFTTLLNKKTRIRVVLFLSKNNDGVNDIKSNWIEF